MESHKIRVGYVANTRTEHYHDNELKKKVTRDRTVMERTVMVAPHFASYQAWKVKRTDTDRMQRSERKKEEKNAVNNSCTVSKLKKPQFASTLQCVTLHNTPLTAQPLTVSHTHDSSDRLHCR
jgi:hypothetical protein